MSGVGSKALADAHSLPVSAPLCRPDAPACESSLVLLNPESTLFVRGATPALLLADGSVHDALPLLTAPDRAMPFSGASSLDSPCAS